ncbi:DUF2158 domain-containing protein [Bacteroidales bacterium OttesenSCG-928-B11]|nr:DUF2158 domain-containing protein [Bacteroidales bacterium OttesenSCG-928-B11]
MDKKFNVGDVVRLKSGGPEMTVEGYLKVMDQNVLESKETTIVECVYYDDNKRIKVTHEQDTLELYQ